MNFGEILDQWDRRKKLQKQNTYMSELLDLYPPTEKKEDKIRSPHRTMAQAKKRKELRLLRPQRQLDLHGLKIGEAYEAIDVFLDESVKSGIRKVLIIHGKGNHSSSGPVLRDAVTRYLQNHPLAGEIGVPDKSDGGSGATWVLVRQRSL